MSQITRELLKAMVPKTKGQMIDKLIDPLNLVLPAYNINTEYRVAAFLATAAPESDWFKTLREYGKGEGRAYGKPDRVTGLVYYGRGIFQNTWKKGYKAFTDYIEANWNSIRIRAAAYGYTKAPNFVNDPELLATPYWAVEAACWYWKVNGLAKYADRGLKGFYGLQGLVNRGSPNKTALGYYEERLPAYEKARRLIEDNFKLGQDEPEIEEQPEETSEQESNNEAEIPIESGTKVEIVDGNIKAETNVPLSQNVVIEKEKELEVEKPKGIFGTLWAKITATLTAIGGTDVAIEKAQQAQTLGISNKTWAAIFWIIVIGLIIWIAYHFFVMKVLPWIKWLISRIRTHKLMEVNSTPTNNVVVADLTPERIKELEAAGWLVVRRN